MGKSLGKKESPCCWGGGSLGKLGVAGTSREGLGGGQSRVGGSVVGQVRSCRRWRSELGCGNQPRVPRGFHPPPSSAAVMKSSSSSKLLEPGQQLPPPWPASSRAQGSLYARSLPGLGCPEGRTPRCHCWLGAPVPETWPLVCLPLTSSPRGLGGSGEQRAPPRTDRGGCGGTPSAWPCSVTWRGSRPL